jgi:hypothetical protein
VIAAAGLQLAGSRAPTSAEPTLVQRVAAASLTPENARGLRDQAEALTPAGVELDETAHETWVPRLGLLERARDDASADPQARADARAALRALAAVGIRARD